MEARLGRGEYVTRLTGRVADVTGAAQGVGLGIALALASEGASLAIIEAVLDRLELRSAFGVVSSAQAEPYGKPHPGIFLTTAMALGVPATACIVLEDSLTGVLAAKAARMTCIAVPDVYPDHDPRLSIADRIVGSLDAVTAELLASVVRRA
jgi:sugar-phosphatase